MLLIAPLSANTLAKMAHVRPPPPRPRPLPLPPASLKTTWQKGGRLQDMT